MKVQELLTDESKWTQGCSARDTSGNAVQYSHESAVSWCLLGALQFCYAGGDFQRIINQIKRHLHIPFINRWNDQPDRIFTEVRKLVVELDL